MFIVETDQESKLPKVTISCGNKLFLWQSTKYSQLKIL